MNKEKNSFNKGKNSDISKSYVDSNSFQDSENLVFFAEGENVSVVPLRGVDRQSWSKNWRDDFINSTINFKCIGSKESEDRNRLFIFLVGDYVVPIGGDEYSDTQFILEYTRSTNAVVVISGGMELGLDKNNRIETHNIHHIKTSDGEYLAWNDKVLPTRFIDIDKMKGISATIEFFVAPPPAEDLDVLINLITTPPSMPPSYEYVADVSVENFNVAILFPLFKYRYIYFDGSVSSFSIASKFIPAYQLDNEAYGVTTKGMNAVEVTYNVDNSMVAYIEVAVKLGDLGVWQKLPLVPFESTGEHKLIFGSESQRVAIGDNPLDTKYYDNVPINNRALAYSNSRLILGGFTEGYSEVTGLKGIASPVYTGSLSNVNLDFEIQNQNTLTASSSLSLAEIQSKADIGGVLDMFINAYVYTDGPPPNGGPVKFNTKVSGLFGVTITSWATLLTEIGDAFVASFTTVPTLINGGGCDGIYYSIASDVITFKYTLNVKATSNWVAPVGFVLEENSTFLQGQTHKASIVYFDEYNRQSDATSTGDFDMYVKELHHRDANINELVGLTRMQLSIFATPPVWAKKYAVCLSELDPSPYHRMTITNWAISKADQPSGDDVPEGVQRIFLKDMSNYKEGTTFRDYQYKEGQFMNILGAGYSPLVTTWEIMDFGIEKIEIVGAGVDTEYSLSDDWEYIEIRLTDWNRISEILLAANKTSMNMFIDIIDSTHQVTGVTREIGEVFEIGDAGLSTRYHKGNIADQGLTETNKGTLSVEEISQNIYYFQVTAGFPTLAIGDYVEVGGIPTTVMKSDDGIDPNQIWVYSNQNIPSGSHSVILKQAARSLITRGNAYGHNRGYNIEPSNPPTPSKNWLYSESYHISDYYPSETIGYGRSHIDVNELRRTDRFAGLMGSSPFVEDSNIFGLKDFPNSAYPFIWLETNNGAVEGLIARNNDVIVIQSQKTGRVLVNKSVLTTADGNSSVNITDIVFGQYVPYNTDNGTRGNDWSIRNNDGVIYFKSNDSAYRLSNDGITQISDYGMRKDFKDGVSNTKLSTLNRRRGEYMVNLEDRLETFNENINQWLAAMTVEPDFITELDESVVSLIGNDAGLYLLIHEQTTNYSELFDANGDLITVLPYIDVAVNKESINTKSYGSIELAGKSLSSAIIEEIETDNQTSTDLSPVKVRENTWVASLNMGSDKGGYGAEYVGLGVPTSTPGNVITYNTILDTTSFSVGDKVFYEDGGPFLLGTIVSYTDNTITLGSPTIAGAGKFLIVSKNSSVEGTSLKGLFLSMRVRFNTPATFRLDAVSVVSTTSKTD